VGAVDFQYGIGSAPAQGGVFAGAGHRVPVMFEPPGSQKKRVLIVRTFNRSRMLDGDEICLAIGRGEQRVFVQSCRSAVTGIATGPLERSLALHDDLSARSLACALVA